MFLKQGSEVLWSVFLKTALAASRRYRLQGGEETEKKQGDLQG